MKLSTPLLLVLTALLSAFLPAAAQVHFDDFSTLEGISMVGSAVARNDLLYLTPSQTGVAGAIWINRQQEIDKGFITRFQFRMKDTLGQPDRDGKNGGDGIAFVIHNSPFGSNALGGVGGHIGYGTIEAVSLAVEFDTYNNSDAAFGDPNGNHISVQGGNARHSNSMGTVDRIPNLSDGRIHTATIEYVDRTLRIYLDACAPIQIEVDLVLPDRAWVGLTSATGAAWESHELISWQFNPLGSDRNYRGQPCDADSVTLTVRGDFASYRWSTGATTRSITVGRTGLYTVEVADTNGCSSLTYSWSEFVDLGAGVRPTISASGPTNFCAGDSVTLTASGTFMRYNWSPTGGIGPTVVARTQGVYFVVAFDSRGCRFISDSIVVTVRPRPNAAIAADGPLTFCEGRSVTLSADSGHAQYSWSTGEQTRSIVVQKSGRYSVTVTAFNGCQSTSAPVDVRVDPAPRPRVVIEGRESCASDSVVLDAGDGYAFYLWSSGETTRKITARGAGQWSVAVRSFGGCNGVSDTVTILPGGIVPPEIIVDGSLPFCVGDSALLTVDREYPTYLWSDGSTGRRLTARTAGRYHVTVTDTNGCVSSDTVDIPNPVVPPVVKIEPLGSAQLCEGDSVILRIAPTTAPILWSTGATTERIVVRFAGIYRVTAGTGGCTASDSIRIDFSQRPAASAGPDRRICPGESVMLDANGGTTFSWTPTIGLSCTTCPTPLASPSQTTRYIVEVGNGGACTAFDTVLVTVEPARRIDAGADRSICGSDTVRLHATGAAVYRWLPATGLDCSDCASPVASPSVTTTYIVSPVGEGPCVGPDTVVVTVDVTGVQMRTSIDRGVRGGPGEIVTARMMLDAVTDAAGVDSLAIVIEYNPRVVLLDPASTLQSVTAGTLLDGWIGTFDHTETGRIVAHLGRGSAGAISGSGAMLNLPFRLFIGDSTGTELRYDLTFEGGRCVSHIGRPGRIEVDSICGLRYRLIEIGTTKYALGDIRPNPSSASATLTFGIGLDGPTTIRLFDMEGREVGRPIDEHLPSGEYQLSLETNALPSGMYFLRMESGEFIKTRRVEVRR